MRQAFVFAVFMLAMAVWTMAQQSGASGTASSSQTPSASQSQSSAPGSAGQGSAQTPGSAQSSGSAQTPGSSQSGAGTQSQSSQTPSASGQGQTSTMPGSAGQGSAQTPGQTPGSAQTPGSSQTPGAAQPPDSTQTPGSAQSQMGNTTVTEGCLGGSNPNFTITDKAGTTYKLNIPAGADVSPLNSHVGESVQVMGQINNGSAGKTSSIDATRIGRGTGNCQAGSSKQTPR